MSEGYQETVVAEEEMGVETPEESSVESGMEHAAETNAMLENAAEEMNMSVAEKIAEVTGGKNFSPEEISKMSGFLGKDNAFIQGLWEVRDQNATAEFEAQAAIAKAQYGEQFSDEDEKKFAEMAEEMGITVEAAKEAMGYHIEEDDTDPNRMQEMRDAMEDFKGKHPKIFKALKIVGLGAVLMTVSGLAAAADDGGLKTGGAGVRANNPVGGGHGSDAGTHAGGAGVANTHYNAGGSGSVHAGNVSHSSSGGGPFIQQSGGAANIIGGVIGR